jgi:hypothetical protein
VGARFGFAGATDPNAHESFDPTAGRRQPHNHTIRREAFGNRFTNHGDDNCSSLFVKRNFRVLFGIR